MAYNMLAMSQMSIGYNKMSFVPDTADLSTWDITEEFSIHT